MKTITLLTAKTTTGASPSFTSEFEKWNHRGFISCGTTSSGTGSATIAVEVSNDNVNWAVAGNINLTLGVTNTCQLFDLAAGYTYARANVTALTGTGASVNVTCGVC